MAFEHVHGIRLDEREALEYLRQKVAIQQSLRSLPQRSIAPDSQRGYPVTFSHPKRARGLDASPSFTIPGRPVDNGGASYPLNESFANLSLNSEDPAQREHAASTSRVPVKMERASTSTSGVSVVVPCTKVSMPDMRDPTKSRRDSFATLAPSSSEPRFGPPSSPASQIHFPGSVAGDRDREYKLWGRLDDPDSVWNALHVERPKLNERRKFSSYREYRKTRNQPMKDNDQLFKKRMKQSFARGEALGVDESGGYVSDIGDDEEDDDEIEGGGERVGVKKAESKRQILLVKRKGNLAGQNL